MRITSMDIGSKEFKRVMRGYNPNEVDEFLDKIADDYEVLYKENSTLKEKATSANEKLEQYARIEATIQNTLILAQNAAEQAKQSAQKEAELIIKNANESAQKILDKAHHDVMIINDDYEKLKQEFNLFRLKFKNFMQTQVDMFETLEKDFIKNYNIGTVLEDLKEKEIDLQDDFKIKNLKEEAFDDRSLEEIKSFFVKE